MQQLGKAEGHQWVEEEEEVWEALEGCRGSRTGVAARSFDGLAQAMQGQLAAMAARLHPWEALLLLLVAVVVVVVLVLVLVVLVVAAGVKECIMGMGMDMGMAGRRRACWTCRAFMRSH